LKITYVIIGVIKSWKSGMGETCINHGRDERCMQYRSFGDVNGRNYLEDLVIDGRVLIKWALKK
jgi:hypothetical protein